jgi:D-alanine-D-alanine ligase
VGKGLSDHGLDVDIVGVHGDDLDELMPRLRDPSFDLVFNIVESLRGDTRNEQVVPALLDLFEIPYTGPDALAIGLCLRKEQCKQILVAKGIATPEYLVVESAEQLDSGVLDETIEGLHYPFFLKLAREDASIGITESNRVDDPAALKARARELAARYDQPVLGERYIEGREVNVTVIGNGEHLEVLPLHEIDFAKMPEGRPHIVSYAAKWDEEHVDYEGTKPVPMRNVAPEIERGIRETAMAAFRALGLRDYGRVDLRIDDRGRSWVIDVNPNCDLSPDAGVARAAEAGGLGYPELVGRICNEAWKRHEHRATRTPKR